MEDIQSMQTAAISLFR